MKPHLNPVQSLVFDRTLYPRRSIDGRLVRTYADAMQRGAKFPPVLVATVNGKRVLVDGWHRVRAAKLLKQANIMVRDLGVLDRTRAFAEAVRQNSINGKPLDYSEKLAAYRRLLKEGISVKRASEEIVFMSEQRMRMYAGRMTGPGSEVDAALLRPFVPVLTVGGPHGFAGSRSLDDLQGLPPVWGIALVRFVTRLLKSGVDWENKELVAELTELRAVISGLEFPVAAG